jgi:ABC-type multidrug transport system ATPase subunit
MTLLLGPPGSGKTSLLLALAGKLDKTLEVSGKVTYNGHEMTEFVPERTCAYISQRDLQMGELTVRETLDFSGRCQGVGPRFGKHANSLIIPVNLISSHLNLQTPQQSRAGRH